MFLSKLTKIIDKCIIFSAAEFLFVNTSLAAFIGSNHQHKEGDLFDDSSKAQVQPMNPQELMFTSKEPDVDHQHITADFLNKKTVGRRGPTMNPERQVENNKSISYKNAV